MIMTYRDHPWLLGRRRQKFSVDGKGSDVPPRRMRVPYYPVAREYPQNVV
jgi:hypothetical protein